MSAEELDRPLSESFVIRMKRFWEWVKLFALVARLLVAGAFVLVFVVLLVVETIAAAQATTDLLAGVVTAERLRSDTNARIVQHFTHGLRK